MKITCPFYRSAGEKLLQLKPRPDAIIGLSDKLTTGCLRALQARNIKVPDEMGLIGISNSDLTELFDPSLSIIRQPAFSMGAKATQLLIDLIESKRPTQYFDRIVLETEIMVRKSSSKKQAVTK